MQNRRPSFGLYFAAAALANIPFWILTGILAMLQLEGSVYVVLLFIVVLLGGMAGGQFLVSRIDGAAWIVGLKAASAASIVNIIFGIGTFSVDYAHALILILGGFLIGGPLGALVGVRLGLKPEVQRSA